MNKQKLFIALACLAVLATSCDKKGTKAFYYTFDNNTDQKMNLKIYQLPDDYNNAKSPYMSYTLQPGEKAEIPSTQFLDTRDYYVDWYNNDFTYSSWFNMQHIKASFSAAFSPSPQHSTTLMNTVHDYARQLCLSGDGTKTTWEAIDGWNFVNGSIGDTIRWAQMNDYQRYNQLVFTKDFSCVFSQKQKNTGVLADIRYVVRTPDHGTPVGSTRGNLYIYTANDWDSLGHITYRILPGADSARGGTASDTLILSMGDKGTWTMIKTDNK